MTYMRTRDDGDFYGTFDDWLREVCCTHTISFLFCVLGWVGWVLLSISIAVWVFTCSVGCLICLQLLPKHASTAVDTHTRTPRAVTTTVLSLTYPAEWAPPQNDKVQWAEDLERRQQAIEDEVVQPRGEDEPHCPAAIHCVQAANPHYLHLQQGDITYGVVRVVECKGM